MTKETCIKCGHVANVSASKLWACAECGRMQRTAALQSQRQDESAAARRDNLVALINTYNESSSPSVPRTDEEHAVERDRAKVALGSIRRNYIEGSDYREFSNGALWPVAEGAVMAHEFKVGDNVTYHGVRAIINEVVTHDPCSGIAIETPDKAMEWAQGRRRVWIARESGHGLELADHGFTLRPFTCLNPRCYFHTAKGAFQGKTALDACPNCNTSLEAIPSGVTK